MAYILSPRKTDATLLANNSQHCAKFETSQTFHPTTFLLFRDRQNEAQHCWIRLHSSSNIVGATHLHYTWFTKSYGLYPSHNAPQVPTFLGVLDPYAHHC